MRLTIFERLLLLSVLPKEHDILTLRVIRELRESLAFTEEELETYEIAMVDGAYKWNDGTYTKDIKIGERGRGIVADTLQSMSAKKKLTEQHIPLYERFVEGAGDDPAPDPTGGE